MSPVSPCIRVCRLDGEGVCVGCFRTRGEIACWPALNDGEKTGVLAGAEERRRLASEGRRTKRCGRCGATFHCGSVTPGKPCWCDALPPIKPSAGGDCLCPVCLAAAVGAQSSARLT
ncbi:MAG: DUF1289 domain-containing protein [Verrucomicrobia bacterium]|nr:DUF1289 domain-containing protein [Verrucomicrobiota bacterium]